MVIGIIDYGLANLKSVENAFKFFKCKVKIITSPKEAKFVDKFVLPGVGKFDYGVKELKKRGFEDLIKNHVIENKKPLFGICLGMQMLFESSEEGSLEGLGIFKGKVKNFKSFETNIKTPHIGWNTISVETTSRILNSIESSSDFYFVHSFFVPIENIYKDTIKSITSYGLKFVSCMEQENIFCTQFHPEKSQNSGLKIIENFIKV